MPDRPLAGVRWIGGGSGAGKSTIARRLAAEWDATVYDTDGVMSNHVSRLDEQRAPLLQRFLDMTMDERWVERQPTEMLESFHWFAGEGVDLIVDDVAELAARGPVVAEGFRLLPRAVAPLLVDPRDAVWLLPTPAFRQMAFYQRGSLWDIADQTTDRVRALANLLERDRLFTERLRAELLDLGLSVIEVDVGSTGDDLYDLVTARLRPLTDL